MTVCDWPSVIVEVTFLTPEMLATASSTRLVTCVSSSLGATPGSVTVTETIGTSMLGKRVIGSFEKLIRPSATSTMNIRIGGTGLRIAQAEKFQFMADRSRLFVADRRHHVAVGDEGAGARNHFVAFRDAGHDLDIAVGARAELDRNGLDAGRPRPSAGRRRCRHR